MEREKIIKALDEDIKSLMQSYWDKYGNDIGVGYSGCVSYGSIIIKRHEHPDGLTFRVTDAQMNELSRKDKTTVHEHQLIQQIHYDEVK